MAIFERNIGSSSSRSFVALGTVLLCFSVIILRLWYLQILNGDHFRNRADNNRLRTVYIPPPRGLILDRNGVVLARNRPAFDVDLVLEDTLSPKETVKKLGEILKIDAEPLYEQLGPQRKRRRFEPRLILRDVDRDTVAKVEARKYELPGVVVDVTPARDYLFGASASHVLGYLREISTRQLDSPSFSGYLPGDLVGQYGLESAWEWFLQGKRGIRKVIVNAMGIRTGDAPAESEPPVPGHNVSLTLDIGLQQEAENAMAGRRGAVVALDPRTGEILTLLSLPGFDPNHFSKGITPAEWKELITGDDKPLLNRAVQGAYPPGSVFKIVVAAAALAEKVTTPSERVNCDGTFQVGSRTFHCHKHTGHGSVNLYEAIVESCDVYFYTMGQRLGVDTIHDYAKRFGFGEATGLKLIDESDGVVPSTEWKRKSFKNPDDQRWYPGETPSIAIGQGAITVTPLQVARALSALVNGGRVLVPHLIKSVSAGEGAFKDEDFEAEVKGNLNLGSRVLDPIRAALVGVVNDPKGTAGRAKLDPGLNITVAGKTGTAQVASLDLSHGNDGYGDHAWFAAYAPAENPEIVVVALVENAGHGGVEAAPVVQRLMTKYFTSHQQGAAPNV